MSQRIQALELMGGMKVAFRADASALMGTGHVMRCLTLADELKRHGAQTCFVSRHMPEHLREMLAAKGHGFKALNSPPVAATMDDLAHAAWLGTTQAADAQDAINALSDQSWDWLVVDHYALDERFESALRQITRKILVIDDIADRRHDCNVLLDQNFYADMDVRYMGKVPEHCILLLGPRYALLRQEFRQFRERLRPRNGSVQRILIFFGGVDAENYTGKAISVLASIGGKELYVDVVIGAQHPQRDLIEASCAEHRFNCHVQTSRMAELMAAADLAIGAAGSATWERCCLGLPALIVSLADNQTKIAQGLDLLGAGKYISSRDISSDMVLSESISDLIKNKDQLRMLSEKAYFLVDGFGVDRLYEALIH